MKAQLYRASLALLCLGHGLVGCGTKTDEEAPPAKFVAEESHCSEDPLDLVGGACVEVDDCPCGTFCEYGLCTVECVGDSNCQEGEACTRFGYCATAQISLLTSAPLENPDSDPQFLPRDLLAAGEGEDVITLSSSGDPTGVPALIPAVDHGIGVSPSWTIFAPGQVQRLTVKLAEQGDFRLLASDVFQVRCEDDGSFATECTGQIDPETLSTQVAVRVDPDAEALPGQAGQIVAFSPHHRATSTVELASTEGISADTLIQDGIVEAGVYEGSFELTKFGSSTTAVQGLLQALAVNAQIFPNGVIHLVETTGQLGLHEFKGFFSEEAGTWSLDLVSGRVLPPATEDLSAEVVLEFSPSEVAIHTGFLKLNLRGAYLGSSAKSDKQNAPTLEGILTLRYTGELDLTSTAPALEDELLSQNPFERSLAVSAYESAVGLASACDFEPLACAQHVLCRQDGQPLSLTVEGNPIPYEFVNTDNDGPSASLRCDSGHSLGFPLFDPVTAQGFGASLSACVRDIGDFLATSVPELQVTEGELDAYLETNGCVSPHRVIAALGMLQEETKPGPEELALANHLLGRWLQTLTFMVNGRLELLKAEASGDVDGPRETLTDVLDMSLKASELVLHPRFNRLLVEQPATGLTETDYRVFFGMANGKSQELYQSPVFADMLDLVSAQSRALAALGRSTCGGSSTTAEKEYLQLVDGFHAHSAPLMAKALFLYQRAEEDSVSGDWNSPTERAVVRNISGTNELNEVVEACREGRNAIGISDLDLPLVFRSPETSAERFSAISDFLIGTTPSSTAWVPSAITEASDALELLRSSSLAAVDRQLMAAKLSDDQQDREAAIHLNYGAQVVTACGEKGGLTTLNSLGQNVDPDTCFVAPECVVPDEQLADRLEFSSVAYDLCVAGKLRKHVGPIAGAGDLEAGKRFLDLINQAPERALGWDVLGDGVCTASQSLVNWDWRYHDCTDDDPRTRDWGEKLLSTIDASKMAEITGSCNALKSEIEGQRPSSIPSSCSQADDCPIGFACKGKSCQADVTSENQDPSCFDGTLGEHALAIRASSLTLDTARAEFAELTERYEIAMKGCYIRAAANKAIEVEQDNFNRTMNDLRDAQRSAEQTAALLDFGTSLLNPTKFAEGLSKNMQRGLKVASLASKAAKGSAKDIGRSLDKARDAHDEAVEKIRAKKEQDVCFNDARVHLVGASSAALRVETAATNGAEELLAFDNAKSKLQRVIDDGRTELAREAAGEIVPLAHDFFIDEKATVYERKFGIAQRATYLAVRAVEYEFQTCDSLRTKVVEARTPDDLDEVISSLLANSSSARLGGKSPSDGLAVVSMRDEILQLQSHEGLEGLQNLTKEERFQVLLTSPRFAAFNSEGEYIGQRIPFSIAPRDSGADAVPLLNGSSCAERLWSVNASLQGQDYMVERDSSFVEITLEKKNTFFSTLCSDSCSGGDGYGRQVASVRPSRNLFADPFYGASSGVSTATGEESEFASGRIRAYRDIERATLESDDYADGDTSELAGRGLWGDYALFIRAADLSIGGSQGLALHKLDDILLRFDYVSVAQD